MGPGADVHDLYRSSRPRAGGAPADFLCELPGLPGTTQTVTEDPLDQILLYLVGGRSCFGDGGLGSATAGLRTTPALCP